MPSWKKVIVSGSDAELKSLVVNANEGYVFIGSASALPARGALDVVWDGYGQLDSTINIGADATSSLSAIRTNNVAKRGIITAASVVNTRNNIGLIAYEASADSSSAILVIGGSGSAASADSPTRIKFATTSSVANTTNYGITRMSIAGDGGVGIGIGDEDPASRVHIRHTVPQILLLENRGTAGTIRVTFSSSFASSTDSYITTNASGGLSIGNSITYANQILFVTESKIGILTSTPQRALDVVGSISASAGFTGSLFGTASWAINALTSSFLAGTIQSASFASTAASASYASSSTSASYALNATTAATASFVATASWANNVLTASFVSTASYANNSNLFDGLDSSIFATTGSNTFRGTQTITGSINISGSINVTGLVSASGYSGSLFGTASWAFSASNAVNAVSASFASNSTSASYALLATTATATSNALTFGVGLSGSAATFNGNSAVTVHISGSSALTSNTLPKWSGTGLTNSNISDNGTLVTIGAGASSGLTVTAGGVNVTGNSTFSNNLTVTGDLTVAGTASFVNADNLRVRDKFISINSGSATLSDSGWVSMYNAAGSGSAFYLEATSAGTYGRFAVAFDVLGTAQSVTPDEFVVTAKTAAGTPPSTPTWGGSTNGYGNIYVNSSTEEIFIYS